MSSPSNTPEPVVDEGELATQRARQLMESDRAAGIEVHDDFARFNQMNDMFTRAFWDESIRSTDSDAFFASYRMEAAPRRGDGFSLKDFALRNAAWSVSDLISNRNAAEGEREGFQAPIRNDTPVSETQLEVDDSQAFTAELKQVARLFGADLVGVAQYDERWQYSARVDTRTLEPTDNSLPTGVSHVIVLGHSMDRELVQTYPSALAGASTGLEYSHEASIVIQLATYLRNLGFTAVASMNDTALVIPYAVKAGLGEYGRNQMVITPEFGPRVRFSKIFTNAPLVLDEPLKAGIREYCDICTVCADACPPKALPFGAPQHGGPGPSNISGITKWTADCEKCFGYWAKLKTDCAICMRVCPFNTDYSSVRARAFYKLATSRFRRLARWWINRKGPTPRVKPRNWWASIRTRAAFRR